MVIVPLNQLTCLTPIQNIKVVQYQAFPSSFRRDIRVRIFRVDESNDLVEGGQLRQTIKAVLDTGQTGYWAGAGNCENLE